MRSAFHRCPAANCLRRGSSRRHSPCIRPQCQIGGRGYVAQSKKQPNQCSNFSTEALTSLSLARSLVRLLAASCSASSSSREQQPPPRPKLAEQFHNRSQRHGIVHPVKPPFTAQLRALPYHLPRASPPPLLPARLLVRSPTPPCLLTSYLVPFCASKDSTVNDRQALWQPTLPG